MMVCCTSVFRMSSSGNVDVIVSCVSIAKSGGKCKHVIKALHFFLVFFFSFPSEDCAPILLPVVSLLLALAWQTLQAPGPLPPPQAYHSVCIFFNSPFSRTSASKQPFTVDNPQVSHSPCARADHQCTAWIAAKSTIPRKDPPRLAWIRGAREKDSGTRPRDSLASGSFDSLADSYSIVKIIVERTHTLFTSP